MLWFILQHFVAFAVCAARDCPQPPAAAPNVDGARPLFNKTPAHKEHTHTHTLVGVGVKAKTKTEKLFSENLHFNFF